MEEESVEKLNELREKKAFISLLACVLISLLTVTFMVINFSIACMLFVLDLFFIIYFFKCKSKIESGKKEIKKNKFELLEKEIGKYYMILDFSDDEFEIFDQEAENVAFDKYYIEEGDFCETYNVEYIGKMLEENVENPEDMSPNITEQEFETADEIPGSEEDYVEGYEEFEKQDLKLPQINLKYVTEFERRNNKIYMMYFEEGEENAEKYMSYERPIVTNYVFISKAKVPVRLHINTKEEIENSENFEDIYLNNEEIIKNETYETGNTFLELNEEDKQFLVDLYNETKLENSIVIKEGKIYIRVSIREDEVKENDYLNISKFFMEIFERFTK